MAERTALDQQAVEKAHELARAVYLPAVRAIRKAMDDLQMTYEAKNPIQGEASHKVLAYEVCVAAFAALADAGYSVVKTEVGQKGDRSRAYLRVEGTTWPNPDDPNSVEWVLRYGQPTKSCLLVAASYIAAYRSLVAMTQKDRNHRVATLRAASLVEPVPESDTLGGGANG